MRSKTRRQEIVGEYRKEQIQMIALILAFLVLLVAMMINCGRTCGCGGADDQGPTEEQTETGPGRGAADIEALWTDMNHEDRQFVTGLSEYPRLVNRDNPLPLGYAPPSPVTLHGMPEGEANSLNYDAARAFYSLRQAMLDDGIAILPLSGYRSYEEQVMIFNYNVQLHTEEGMTPEEARAYTERFVSLPGTSEHQYGRSIDVTLDGTTDHSFHETEQGQWLIDHAHEFGFVIRYPEDKEEVTGIGYEPWHLRWVGVEHAGFMTRYNLCLEEYIEMIRKYNSMAVMIDE